jgi:ubiquinone/menaquinone biosynthesis C-methylase UbiE
MKSHKITKENYHKLDDPAREEILKKSDIFDVIGNMEGKVLADIGCGTGYYTLDFSRLVGPEGLVYSMDVNPELLEKVTYKTKDLKNVINSLSSEESIPVKVGVIDVCISIQSFHEFDDKEVTLNEIKRILKPGGRLIIIDWAQISSPPPGPPTDHRILKEDVILIAEDIGFEYVKDYAISQHHYALEFKSE